MRDGRNTRSKREKGARIGMEKNGDVGRMNGGDKQDKRCEARKRTKERR